MPNTLAYLVFFSAPLVIWLLFRRQPFPAAIAATIIGGYLFLPSRVNFDLPILPALNKHLLPGLVAILLVGSVVKKLRGTGVRLGTGTQNNNTLDTPQAQNLAQKSAYQNDECSSIPFHRPLALRDYKSANTAN